MHRSLLFFLSVATLAAQSTAPTVGSGAPTAGVTNDFLNGYFRNNFFNLVSPTPLANVAKYGSTGYYQEFTVLNTTPAQKAALILPSLAASGTQGAAVQVIGGMYAYYTSLGVNTVGYPTADTQACPGVAGCQYQPVSGSYALFYYASGNPNGTGFSVSGNLFTAWTALGGVGSLLGPVYDAAEAVTSSFKTTATQQTFTGGIAFSPTAGVDIGNGYAVATPIYAVFQAYGGATGTLGLPTSNDLTLADGSHRQIFEGGTVVYTVGSAPTVQLSLAQVSISPVGPLNLQLGQTAVATASLMDRLGTPAFGRAVSWATSNSSAVTISPSGYSVTLTAVSSGTAQITATSGGVVSAKLVVSVNAPCCQIGEGAPTSVIQQAFQNAVARNHLTVTLPAATPVRRAGSGYVQDLYSPDGSIHYLVAESDGGATAYVVSGAALLAYNAAGGPTGTLGYPSSDFGSGGTQLFQSGALSGNPVQIVTGAILAKWAALQYEAGPAGAPVAAPVPFTSLSAYTGYSQSFAGGAIYGIGNGSLAGQAYFSSGPILARYRALAGPAGELGVPLSDLFAAGMATRQSFENGYIDLQPGASIAIEHLSPRTPTVSANPSSILAGSRLHLAISGFSNNAALRVSQTGQPDFLVTAANGGYSWETYISSTAAAATITLTAVDTGSGATATGTYTIRSLAAVKPQIAKSLGDGQTGTPGVALPVPLTVTLTDSTGTPLAGSNVSFSPSPGATVSPTTAITDSSGHASTILRLPPAAGVAAVTAQALGQIAIFDAEATGSTSLVNFPSFSAATPTGSQVAALAAMIRFYQNEGAMPTANGSATAASLDKYLASLTDGYLDPSQLVNLWRLVGFTGGNVSVSIESTDASTIRGFVAGGDPVLLSLALTEDGGAVGGATVVATGANFDGSLAILDPAQSFSRIDLSDYLNGFVSNGHSFQGAILSAVRLLPRPPAAASFILESVAQPFISQPVLTASAATQSCPPALTVQDPYTGVPAPLLSSQFVYCDGLQPLYQVGVTGLAPYGASLLDLGAGGIAHDLSGSGAAAYQVARVAGALSIAPPIVSFSASSIVNAASFAPGISPGSLISIFGIGLSGLGTATTVTIGGQAATVLFATPFQINAQVPAGATAGYSPATVKSAFGAMIQTVNILTSSPGIFAIGTAADGISVLGTIFNQNGMVNGITSPAPRGSTIVIYCTGLGPTALKTNLQTATQAVTVSLGSTVPSRVVFAGLTPGFIGLYQANFAIPPTVAPGLFLPLSIQIGGNASNVVAVAVQ